MTDEINTILNTYHSNTLKEMAIAAGMEVMKGGKKLSKAALMPKMRAEFFSRERVLASLAHLSERERAVLDRLLLRGGKTSTRSFQREIIRAGLATQAQEPQKRTYYNSRAPYADGYIGDPGRGRSPIFEDVIARLTYHGLVFSQGSSQTMGGTPYKIQFHPATILYIPQIIQRYLPEPEPVPVGIADWQPTRTQSGEPALLLRDLYLYWDFVRRNPVTLIQGGFVGKRWLKAINEILLVSDPTLAEARREDETGRLQLLRQLLMALKLIRAEKGQLLPAIAQALQIPDFWSQSAVRQLGACLEVWPRLSGLQELGNEAAQYGPNYQHARQTILTILKTLPPNVWLEPEEFLEQVQAQDVDFLFPEHSRVENYRGSWYYSHYSLRYFSGQTQTILEAIQKYEAEFVHRCLTGFFHQLGIIELGYDADELSSQQNGETLKAFRLTSVGQALLGTTATTELAEHDTGKLIVQPNFQLLAMGPVSLAMLAQLDLFADRQGADRGAFEYHLSRDSIYRAQQQGLSVAEIMRFLTETGQVELPQNVRRSLEEWAAHHERIVFRTGVNLLQAARAELLTTLMDKPAIGKQLTRSLAPEVALIKKTRQQALVSTLVEEGLFPAISGANPESADHSVIIQEDGLVRPIHAVPGLHLRGRLAQVAEETGDGIWQLTPASVRRSGGSKNKILQLLEELGKLHRGQLPEKLVAQIKAWGNYYGDAAVETLTLIEFRDHTVLAELGAHPSLKGHLIPFSADNRALAVIAPEKLADVKEHLSRFGVQVKEGLPR